MAERPKVRGQGCSRPEVMQQGNHLLVCYPGLLVVLTWFSASRAGKLASLRIPVLEAGQRCHLLAHEATQLSATPADLNLLSKALIVFNSSACHYLCLAFVGYSSKESEEHGDAHIPEDSLVYPPLVDFTWGKAILCLGAMVTAA